MIERMFGNRPTVIDPEYGEVIDPEFDDTTPAPGRRLDEFEPGPVLAALLQATNVTQLSGHDRIIYLRAQQRMASHYAAGVYQAMTAVTEHMRHNDDDHLLATEAAAAEIRVAMRLTRRATDNELSFALELHQRLPQVWAALHRGDIDVRRAKTIAYQTTHLPIATARNVVAEIINEAPQLTTGQLAARLKKLCIEANPDEAADRYRHAVEERRCVVEPTVDGTSNLTGYAMAPDKVARAMERINRIARSLRGNGETRTIDQLRADVFLDLLNGTGHHQRGRGPKGVIDMHVDLETLTRLSNKPGELGGYRPVIADIARQVADESPNAEWRFTITDPDTGQPIGGGTTRRRPTARQRRHIQARDRTCIFPGCRMPATGCDIDHTIAYADHGPTTTCNCGPLCRHDHGCKHKHGWTYHRLPNGDYQWTTKLGHTYTTNSQPP